jgi:LacI family transcriptional regulator
MTENNKLKDTLKPAERERPTLKTIARLSGLAVPTVSRALGDAPDIGSDTKKRVREIADQLGYRPNRAGLRLRTGKTNVIALVLRTDHDLMSHASRLITAIAGELRGTAYHLIIIPYFPDENPLDAVRYIVRTGSADGIILNRIQPDDPRVNFLRAQNFPFALHGRTSQSSRDPFYDFDNAEYGRQSVATVAARGRRELLMIAPPRDQNYSQLMIGGAEEGGRQHGVRVRIMEDASSDSSSDAVTTAAITHLTRHPECDAIMTASAPSAVAATLAAETLGLTIGKDIDVIAKESMPFLKHFRSEIIVIHEDINETGQFLARAIIQAIDRPELPPMQKLLMLT